MDCSKPLFRDLSADDPDPETTEIESLCMNCHATGITRLLLTKIPFYKELVLMSFTCTECGYQNNEIQSGAVIGDKGIQITLKVNSQRDLNRQIVKSDFTSIKIVELDFEIPAKSQKGEVTTIEGVLTRSIRGLEQDQPVRRIEHPEEAAQIDEFIKKLEKLKEIETPFTIILQDNSGNSFIENPYYPKTDKDCSITYYTRHKEQDHELGIFTQEETTGEKEKSILHPISEGSFRLEHLEGEVLQFPTNCPNCSSPCQTNMKMTRSPLCNHNGVEDLPCLSSYNNSLENKNLTDNDVTPNKIQVIEDWLLGTEAKCLYAVHSTKQKNDMTTPSTLLPITKTSEGDLLEVNQTSTSNTIESSKISEKSTINWEDGNNSINENSDSTDYVSDSYKSKLENDDDSVADPDYNPISPEDLRIRHMNCSSPSNSELSTEIHFVSKISSRGKDQLPQNSKSSTNVSSQDTPVVVDSVAKEISKLGDERMVETVSRKNYTDRRDFCIFCEKDVSHFARHMFKWHEQEFDVQRILSIKKNSRETFSSSLRKQGNFLRNRTDMKLRPVKRLQMNQKLTSSDSFLPCKYCLGFYMKKSLFRHTKKCLSNYDKGITKERQTFQSDGQTTLMLHSIYKHDELLKSKIFPRMRADEIGLIAKKDSLICKYAYSYIKGRQSKGNLDLVRQNMRRLAKLLQHARNENCGIKQLMDVLHPCHFQLIIAGVNKIAQYKPETESYESPTLAMNFGTLIKKCCDLAYVELLQIKNTNEQRKDLNILKRLIESQWADEVSAQAGTNLNQNKWNKDELLPLTSDLKKLNLFLQKTSEAVFNNLKDNENDAFAYNTMKDVLYTQIILLNRRRPAEVAQLKVQTFKSINLENDNTNEFKNCLTETEKNLLSTYSRFIIRGKRGRGVPVLLSPEMKKHFDLLIKVRRNFVSDNDFVFHTTEKGFIDGTKVLHKYVDKCKVVRPGSITATRLRKHLATITQLLQFSNNDMEQLSKFMGHTLKTHCSVYRMSDKIYQTAKVSKLLLLMMEGGAEEYRGKTLDEIDIDLNPIYDDENVMQKINLNPVDQENLDPECKDILNTRSAENICINLKKENNKLQKSLNGCKIKPRRKIIYKRQTWTAEQKKIITKYFSQHIIDHKPPKQHEVKEFINVYSELFAEKKWTSIKAIVYNLYTGKLKSGFNF